MLTDEQKDDFLQLINNIESALDKLDHVLNDDPNVTEELWKLYDVQLTKAFLRLNDLRETVYGS